MRPNHLLAGRQSLRCEHWRAHHSSGRWSACGVSVAAAPLGSAPTPLALCSRSSTSRLSGAPRAGAAETEARRPGYLRFFGTSERNAGEAVKVNVVRAVHCRFLNGSGQCVLVLFGYQAAYASHGSFEGRTRPPRLPRPPRATRLGPCAADAFLANTPRARMRGFVDDQLGRVSDRSAIAPGNTKRKPLSAAFLPETYARTLLRRANELNPRRLKDALHINQCVRTTWWNPVVALKPFYGVS